MIPPVGSDPELRLRFAPSPTGYLHVGSAQSALFNWLYARGRGGTLCLRIEDTDTERNQPELTENILEMLDWLGIGWDEPPVHQSDRFDLYRAEAARLVDAGHLYACDCTPEQVQARHAERGGKPGYDGFCRDRGLEPGPGRVLRFRVPRDGVTAWSDLIRGDVSFDNANIEDFVLVRSSGVPLFLLANVVDDVAMRISHVVRGEDHVNNTPKYLLIRDALGATTPITFAHLPLLVNEARKKLSKRRDDVSVADYCAQGYLPEAMRNYLALLGWGPRDGVEIRPIEEIIELFDLADVSSSPAFFDVKKLQFVNGEYLRAMPTAEFVARASSFVPNEHAARALEAMGEEVQTRVKTLVEVNDHIDFLWMDELVYEDKAWQKDVAGFAKAGEVLEAAAGALAGAPWNATDLHGALEEVARATGFVKDDGMPQLAKAQRPVRVAITGRSVGPPLFESMVVLGRDRVISRLVTARRLLEP